MDNTYSTRIPISIIRKFLQDVPDSLETILEFSEQDAGRGPREMVLKNIVLPTDALQDLQQVIFNEHIKGNLQLKFQKPGYDSKLVARGKSPIRGHSSQFELKHLIDVLIDLPRGYSVMELGCARYHYIFSSYRVYGDLTLLRGLEMGKHQTVGDLVFQAEQALGKEFNGYKGGAYKAGSDTVLWIVDEAFVEIRRDDDAERIYLITEEVEV